MKIDIEVIKKNLNTDFLGRNIIYVEEIDSTQDEVKRRANELQDGTYIITDKQIKGKGTHDRIWYDRGYENICGSFILKPECDITKINNLTKLIAECIVRTINNLYGIKLDIKEPNDVIYNSKKIAGILTESITYNNIVRSIVIGIGFNVNQTEFQDSIIDIATSLKNETGNDYKREIIISEFFNVFEKEYMDLIR